MNIKEENKINSNELIIPQYYTDKEVIPYWNLKIINHYNNKENYPFYEDCQKLFNVYKGKYLLCFQLHENVMQTYDNIYPYAYHLVQVIDIAEAFIPNKISYFSPSFYEICILAAALHDSIEDARMTYNDINKFIKENYFTLLDNDDLNVITCADIIYALTDEKGKNRKERHSEKYWKCLLETPGAVFIKCCDRLANLKYSEKKGSRMFDLYIKEMPDFIKKIENADDWKLFDVSDTRVNVSVLNKLKSYIN